MRSLAARRFLLVMVPMLLLTAFVDIGSVGAQDDQQDDAPESRQENDGQEIDGLEPGVPAPGVDEVGVVHSWALAPAGAGDGSQASDRADLRYDMAPGTEIDDAVTLFNLSNVPLEFDVYVADAQNNDDGAFAPLTAEQDSVHIGEWVQLPFGRITVPAGQQATMPITVSVPADAVAGDYAGAVLAANVAEGTGADGRIVDLDRRTGTRVYVRVEGPLEPELAVAGLSTTYEPSVNPFDGSAVVTYRIENRGNVVLAGTHQPSISGPFGAFRKRGGQHEIPELLPGESIEVTETFDGVAATMIAITEVDLQPVGVRGDSSELDAAGRSAMSLALPVLFLALVLAGGFVWVALKRFRRHRDGAPVVGAELS